MSNYKEENTSLVYEVVADVRFGHALTNRKNLDHEVAVRVRFGHSVMTTVSLVMWEIIFLRMTP
jgi:hypothetical protein